MNPVQHTIASAATSAVFYGATHSIEGTVACFLSGIFIDVDHVFDLWVYKKRLFFTMKELMDFCMVYKDGKLTLIFHSYELQVLLWAAILIFKLNAAWWGLAIGISVHMILDQVSNPVRPLVYFLSYRIKHNFSREYTFSPEKYKEIMEA